MNTKAGNGIVQVLDFENDQQVDSYTKTSKFITCTLFTSSSNCKLSTIEGIGNILAYGTNAQKKYKLDQILTKCRIVTYINTNLSPVKDFIENNYELYESIKIPVGYSGGYQYHLFIRNSLGIKNETMRPT